MSRLTYRAWEVCNGGEELSQGNPNSVGSLWRRALGWLHLGACRELFELVLASAGEESRYGAIVQDLQANIVIDIILGASAGGLNGPVLAQPLVFGTDFTELESFWLDVGDIRYLLNCPTRPKLEYLLDEGLLEEKLREALGSFGGPMDRCARVDSLDLFVATTDLYGQGGVIGSVGFGRRLLSLVFWQLSPPM